jgi:hypothetical protein
VPDDPYITLKAARPASFGTTFKFNEVFKAEIELINKRRRAHRNQRRDPRGTIKFDTEQVKDISGERVSRPSESASVVGLALSGGGIRSAAFCLGALQALDVAKVVERVDYLSTVSGGGYIGCSLTAGLESSPARVPVFPFSSRLQEDEPPALQHIRDFSNYLFPNGICDLLANASIYTRGLAVNTILVGQFLLAATAITIMYFSFRAAAWWPKWLVDVPNGFGDWHFFLTLCLAVLLFLVGILWALHRSMPSQANANEMRDAWTKRVRRLVVLFFGAAFCEFQPFILDAMLEPGGGSVAVVITHWISVISTTLAPLGAAMAFLANKLGEYVKSNVEASDWTAPLKAYALKAAIVVAGFILPALLWMLYLDIAYWGICGDLALAYCAAPGWLDALAKTLFCWTPTPVAALYLAVAVLCVPPSLFMRPNANSLHPLYRDRLHKAFIFNPWKPDPGADELVSELSPLLSGITKPGNQSRYEKNKDPARLFHLNGPYHLINTALNVEASKIANRRGRNADFFIFSPLFVGSKSTDYVATPDIEDVASGLDLATAMAASGAAVSSNMGAQSIKPLTATLALLNIRLGYWLRNPLKLADAKPLPADAGKFAEFLRRNNLAANYYFVLEIFGLLSEKRKSVYLTDGGHIENLGIYELLRRRCRVIIAVDAEADPQMAFGSFNTLERYALIDLGVRIDLPWQKIAEVSLATGKDIDEKGSADKKHGPHCAIGTITYPDDRRGVLIYIKASLTGDENDYIFDYKRRYSDFPHETTLDQLFTEEQFEAYRALGFHAAFRLFDRDDEFAHLDLRDDPGSAKEIHLLDRLFPRPEPDGEDPPHQKTTFAEWVT